MLTVVKWILVLVGVPIVLLFALGVYANSRLAERLAWSSIRRECERHGCTDVEPFTNSRASFGVRYRKNGRKYRGKCTVSPFGKVTWLKNGPHDA